MIINKMVIYKISNIKINAFLVIIFCKIFSIIGNDINDNKKNTIILDIKTANIDKTILEKERKEKNYYNLIINRLVPNNLYIDFAINSENVKIPGYLTFTTQYNYYGTDTCLQLENDNIFNISASVDYLPSFQLNSEYQKYFYLKENISIYDIEKNSINIDNIDIVLPENNENKARCLIVGLNPIMNLKQYKGMHNLPLSIKSNKIKNNFQTYLTILYNISNGIMLLGNPPHIIYPNLFNIKNYKEIENYNMKQDLSSFYIKNHNIWSLKIDQIYFGNKSYSENQIFTSQFSLDYIPFMVPMEVFRKYLSYGLDFYISNNICTQKGRPLSNKFAHSIANDKRQTFVFISCDKNKIENISEFYERMPDFSLRNKELNKTFIFKGKDLFFEESNFLVLMIMPDLFNKVVITLGKIFMEKYLFCFNYDRNVIGFYDESISWGNNKFKSNIINESKFPVELIFVLIFIFFTICFLFFMIKFFRGKKNKGNIIMQNDDNKDKDDLIERELIDVKGENEN